MKFCRYVLITLACVLSYYHPVWAAETVPQSGQTMSLPGTPLTDIASISGECGLTTSGGVKCWGKYTRDASSLVVDMPNLTQGVHSLSTGSTGDVRCALLTNGKIECWNKGYEVPASLVELNGFTGKAIALAAGGPVCALLEDGRIQCVGNNTLGQLGNGTVDPVNGLTTVLGIPEGAIAVENSNFHACAITTQQRVKCWGDNDSGQLGDGTMVLSRSIPTLVSGLTTHVVEIGVGIFHTCAMTIDGSVSCWGDNAYGQLGDSTSAKRNFPVTVAGLGNGVKSITVGYTHNCALLDTGIVKCWGDNAYGQLGDGTTVLTSTTPVTVTNLAGTVVELTSGYAFTCARLQSNQVQCWGDGVNNSKLTPQFYSVPTPLTAITQPVKSLFTASLYQTGSYQTCWSSDLSQIFCQEGHLKTVVAESEPIKQFAKGWMHICILTEHGSVKCKGNNNLAQLGNGTMIPYSGAFTETTTLEIPISLDNDVAQIIADSSSTCVIQNGDAKCWGSRLFLAFPITKPSMVSDLPKSLEEISTGLFHTCAVASDYSVRCWGAIDYQLENGAYNIPPLWPNDLTPRIVNGTENSVVSIDTGSAHTCGVTIQGGVKCWGRNDLGQLGVSGIISSASAIDVVGLSNVQKVVAGAKHTCALLKSGGVKCWGANFGGQLGDGTTDQRNIPTDVLGLNANVLDIDAGEDFTCVILQDRSVRCFGATNRGQINSTMIFDQPTTIITELLPHLSTTHQEGKVGSVFTINGIHFPPNQLLPIFINGTPFGAAQTTATGELIFFVDTQELSAGDLTVGVGNAAPSILTFTLTNDNNVQLAQGGGNMLRVPDQFLFQYLPIMTAK